MRFAVKPLDAVQAHTNKQSTTIARNTSSDSSYADALRVGVVSGGAQGTHTKGLKQRRLSVMKPGERAADSTRLKHREPPHASPRHVLEA